MKYVHHVLLGIKSIQTEIVSFLIQIVKLLRMVNVMFVFKDIMQVQKAVALNFLQIVCMEMLLHKVHAPNAIMATLSNLMDHVHLFSKAFNFQIVL
jgi:2-polyprenyl-3-methyl-5-hydroxy-6-metoxy-1,4-benzoquinol methylase